MIQECEVKLFGGLAKDSGFVDFCGLGGLVSEDTGFIDDFRNL